MEIEPIIVVVPRRKAIRRVAAAILFALSVYYFYLVIGFYAFMAESAFDDGIRYNVASLIFYVVSVFIFVFVFQLIIGYGRRAILGDHDPSGAFWWYSLACNLFLLAPYVLLFNYNPAAVDKSWDQESVFYGSFPLAGIILSAICL